jgi:hypothetical protein
MTCSGTHATGPRAADCASARLQVRQQREAPHVPVARGRLGVPDPAESDVKEGTRPNDPKHGGRP